MPLFTPDDIPVSARVGWWKADDAASIDEVAGRVEEWRDQWSGKAVTQTNNTFRPDTGTVTINGLNALRSDGTRFLDAAALIPDFQDTDTTGLSIFVIGKADQFGIGMFVAGTNSGFDTTELQAGVSFPNPSTEIRVWSRSGSVDTVQPVNSNHTGPITAAYKLTSGTGNLQASLLGNNATDSAGTRTVDTSAIDSVEFFAQDGNQIMTGNILEIIILKADTTYDNLREKIEGYMAFRAGVNDDLLSGHPYKNNPPFVGQRTYEDVIDSLATNYRSYDGSIGSSVSLSLSSVTQIDDQSPAAGPDLTQPTGVNQFTYDTQFGGHNVLRSDGDDTMSASGIPFLQTGTPSTIFAVYSNDVTAQAAMVVNAISANVNDRYNLFARINTDDMGMRNALTNANLVPLQTSAGADGTLAAITYNGASAGNWVDAVDAHLTSAVGSVISKPNDIASIGTSTNGVFAIGSIDRFSAVFADVYWLHAAAAFDRVLTTSEIQQLQGAAAWKWWVQGAADWPLQPDHPFFDVPPAGLPSSYGFLDFTFGLGLGLSLGLGSAYTYGSTFVLNTPIGTPWVDAEAWVDAENYED